ncbi:spinster family MFS transporter [Parvibaculum sp.]|uniref:spinster family MFS transporter n=1 Tax=Parvibaculum sp. TaxID=2024848 RepID=UPI003BA8F9F9
MAEAAMAKGAAPAKLSPGYRRYALMILVLGYTSSHVDRNIMGILLEPIKADLLLSDTQLGFLSGIAFAIFYATLGIPIALVADRGNRRNIIAWAIAIWSGMTALCGLAGNFWQLALARIGVGVGEAGSSPPSHSMIADMYGPNERASAMAVYSLGVYFGVMIGFLVGGWVAVWYGWRAAFFVVGLPGLLLALLVRFTLVEPERGGADGMAPEKADAPLNIKTGLALVKEGFHHLWHTAAARHVVCGVTITSFVGYGGVMWGPAFLIRTHGMSIGEVSTFLAIIVGVVGGLGAYIGGHMTDRLAQKDERWNTWVVAWAKVLVVPFIVAFYSHGQHAGLLSRYVPGLDPLGSLCADLLPRRILSGAVLRHDPDADAAGETGALLGRDAVHHQHHRSRLRPAICPAYCRTSSITRWEWAPSRFAGRCSARLCSTSGRRRTTSLPAII